MVKQHITLMINSTFYDMMAEYTCFLNEVFPKLKQECSKHDIDIEFRDVAFSVPKKDADKNIILQDFRCIDEDRTFFICFRGQKLGWKPTHENVNGVTVDEYPELVQYIGSISITELAIMHALVPFDRYIDGVKCDLKPVKHSLFYFRNSGYENDLSDVKQPYYMNKSNGKLKEAQDIEIARAKDLIYEMKLDFDKSEDGPRVIIRQYDAVWDNSSNCHQMFLDYADKYSELVNEPLDDIIEIHEQYLCSECGGSLTDLRYEGRPLGEVIYEDIMNELKIEFPENFE